MGLAGVGGEGEWVISAARKQFISAQIKQNPVLAGAVFAVRGAAGELGGGQCPAGAARGGVRT